LAVGGVTEGSGVQKSTQGKKVTHISKIEMWGFKSFGNTKVSLPLSPGLTAVIGPNGSGKSNIIDALCFVLGWTSAKTMRAERISDLLFNGGNGHRQAPFAEVSLYFDNSDGALPVDTKTVVISRRADRSGNCVYRLNKKRVSRQEIVDLLAKTMSTSGGHNFVMQGDVDRFIKMSPLDRRAIIDDLAGIAEYDEKKQKSLTELQRVEMNLQSMGAILNEISMQMEKLRSEKDAALRYRQLKAQLEQTRAILLCAQRDMLKRRLFKLQQGLTAGEQELHEISEKQEKIVDEISQHERKVKQLDKFIEEKRSADVLAATEKLRERVRILTEMATSAAEERAAIEAKIAQTQAAIEKARGEMPEKADEDREKLLKEINRVSMKFTKLHQEFNAIFHTLNKIGYKSLAEARRALDRLHEVLDEMHQILIDFDTCIKRSSKLLEPRPQLYGGPDVHEAGSELQRLQTQLITLQGQRVQLDRRLRDLQQESREAQVALNSAAEQESEVRESIRAAREEKEHIQRKISFLRDRATHLQGEIQALEDKLQGYRIEEARLQVQLDAAEKESRNLKVKVPPNVDILKLQREIEALEPELEALGPINFRAVRDFRNAERRYISQKLRYDKLIGERQAILNFMEEIDRKKTEVFMKTFNEISRSFGEIFSELSPGGTARLVLENQERPLEGGLEIEAKPAGKELVRVGALSGGEKALTALAFIFAIQRVRPTTFYVLDEIDAHLDDENLRRVAELLHKSSRRSQILVVTLRDTMMSVADRLFGVSMDSSGISHLVSVELTGIAA
jgi:chromosome segregation ATPase